MRSRQRRLRDSHSAKVQEQEFGRVFPEQLDAVRIVQASDVTLELLVTTCTEMIERPKARLRDDEKAITTAMANRGRLVRALIFIAHATVARAVRTSNDELLRSGMAVLSRHYALSEDEAARVESALCSFELGYGHPTINLTLQVFSTLLGEEGAAQLALADTEPGYELLDAGVLDRAWDNAEERVVEQLRIQSERA